MKNSVFATIILTMLLLFNGYADVAIDNSFNSAENLNKIASIANKSLPMMINKDTKILSCMGYDSTFTYTYQLINHKANEINLNADKETIISRACSTPEIRKMVQKEVDLYYTYYDQNNIFVGEIIVTEIKCLVRDFIINKKPQELKTILSKLNDKEYLSLDIDYRELEQPFKDIYSNRLGERLFRSLCQ